MSSQLTRAASFGAADLAARTVPVVLSTGAPVKRWDEVEVLDLTRVDLSRGDLPLIEVHDTNRVNVGQVRRLRVDGGVLRGDAVFGLSARADELLADVQAGIVTGVSIGYAHTDTGVAVRLRDGTPALSYGFCPHEVSIVPVPADIGAGFHRSLPSGVHFMLTTTTAHAEEIRAIATRAHVAPAFAETLIQRGATPDEARAAIVEHLGLQDRAAGGHINVDRRTQGQADAAHPTRAMADALVARMSGTSAPDNAYAHARIADLCREMLEIRGIRTTAFSPDKLIERAHATGDFPQLLQGAGQRVLRTAYSSYQGGLKRIARASTARDFRQKTSLSLSEFPALLKVGEHSEFKHGSMAEAKASYSLATYGRVFSVTRQALINDDLDAFGDLIGRAGRAAAELEAQTLVDLLTGNPTMADGDALFHANHGNLGTGAGSALQISSLTTARTAMRLQKGLDGATPIDATPAYLVVPAVLESTAQALLATITPALISSVNPFAGALQLVVDPRLDAKSATAWYLAAEPNLVEGLEYSYLESAGGPEVLVDEGWTVDGVEVKCRLDFGAGVLDHRGLYKSNGA
jgi:phage head maturation protease